MEPSRNEKKKCSLGAYQSVLNTILLSDRFHNLCQFGDEYPLDAVKLLMVYSLYTLIIMSMLLGAGYIILFVEHRKRRFMDSVKFEDTSNSSIFVDFSYTDVNSMKEGRKSFDSGSLREINKKDK